MSVPINPRPLTPTEFTTMTGDWQKLMATGDIETLRIAFASSAGPLSNYAYLPGPLVGKLLHTSSKTVAIRTKFVLADASPTFSLAVYGIDPAGTATTPYFLMGTAAVPASIHNVMALLDADEEIPAAEAAAWVMNWHGQNADNFTAAPFASSAGMLRGYTFPISDFQDPWPAAPGADAALWLNFDMHAPDFIPPVSPGQLLFSTIVTLNTVPSENTPGTIVLSPALRYYDVSRPCPPYCDAYQPGAGQ